MQYYCASNNCQTSTENLLFLYKPIILCEIVFIFSEVLANYDQSCIAKQLIWLTIC